MKRFSVVSLDHGELITWNRCVVQRSANNASTVYETTWPAAEDLHFQIQQAQKAVGLCYFRAVNSRNLISESQCQLNLIVHVLSLYIPGASFPPQ